MDFLNLNSWKAIKTEDLQGMYDQEKLSLARKYQQEKEQVSLISSTLNLIVMLVLMFSGAYAWLDNLLRQYTQNEMILSVLFFGFLGFCTSGMHLPFQMYNTFVIEEKYGFNKTTPATFVKDLFVGMVLSSVVGGGLLILPTKMQHNNQTITNHNKHNYHYLTYHHMQHNVQHNVHHNNQNMHHSYYHCYLS